MTLHTNFNRRFCASYGYLVAISKNRSGCSACVCTGDGLLQVVDEK